MKQHFSCWSLVTFTPTISGWGSEGCGKYILEIASRFGTIAKFSPTVVDLYGFQWSNLHGEIWSLNSVFEESPNKFRENNWAKIYIITSHIDYHQLSHSDSEPLEIGILVLGHLPIRSPIHSHRSLVCLLRTARFAQALRTTHSFAHVLTHLLLSSWDSDGFLSKFKVS